MRERPTLSRRFHDLSFRDTSESLCSRAWRLQGVSPFWKLWVIMFGRSHCRRSYQYYWVTLREKTRRG